MDVDTKPGKVGQATLDELELLHGLLPATLTIRTPSGGVHYYFAETNSVRHGNRVSAFGKDVDSTNYVLIPGCALDIGGEYAIINDAPIAPAPDWFAEYLDKQESAAVEQVPDIELDKPENVEWAINYLTNDAPPCVQGQNGEFTMLSVYAELKDHGISIDRAIELVEEHYNVFDKCDPLWNLNDGPIADRHDIKAQNAYGYLRQNAPGSNTAEADFTNDPLSPEEQAALDADVAKGWEKYEERLRDQQQAEDDAEDAKPKDSTVETQLFPLAEIEPKVIRRVKTLCNEWVWATGIERFINRRSPSTMWKAKQFDSEFNPVAGKGSISTQLFGTEFPLRRFKTMVFAPGKPEVTGGNYNGWRGSPIKPVKGDTTLWNKHLEYLFPGEAERNEVLNWLAWVLQNPGLKPHQALLIVGKNTGTGKSIIARVMEQLVGPVNTQRPKNSSLGGDFNSWLLSCRLCIIEELMQVGRRENLNALRDIITEPFVEVNIKGIPAYKIPNYVAMLGISNHPDALPLDETDRRWDVVGIPDSVKEQTKAYYDALCAVTVDDKPMTPRRQAGLAAIFHELLNRPLRGWAPRGHALVTDAKRDMISRGEASFTRWLRQQIDGAPFTWKLVNIRDDILSAPIPDDVKPRGDMEIMVADFLKAELRGGKFLDPSGNEVRHRIGRRDGPKRTLWGINGGFEKYKDAASRDRVAAYIKERDPHNRIVRTAEAAADFEDDE